MVHPWKCPKCGRTVKKYQTFCDDFNCEGERGAVKWIWGKHRLVSYFIIFLFILTLASIIIGAIY